MAELPRLTVDIPEPAEDFSDPAVQQRALVAATLAMKAGADEIVRLRTALRLALRYLDATPCQVDAAYLALRAALPL